MVINRFEALYTQGVPPWEIGRPQPALVALADAGRIAGPVLDSGCGTGENALFLAARGLEVVGVDISPTAIGRARQKAQERGVQARFEVADALDLGSLGARFPTVVDSGVFHVFSDERRPDYVASLAAALEPGGRLHMLVFSDQEPGDWGPRRISQHEIRASFAAGWEVEDIVLVRFETNLDQAPVKAWLASVRRS